MTFTLEVKKRDERGKALKRMRATGVVPGVMYGAKEASVSLSVDGMAFEKLLKEAGESSVITLTGLDDDKDVLIQEVSFDPVRGGVAHVDFYAIEANKELTTHVPLTFVGEAPALKLGGVVSKALHEVEVTCLPKHLPHDIEVDLTVLTEMTSVIHVSDLKIPTEVRVSNALGDVVASVTEVVEEKVEEAPEAIDMASIEVEKKGKEEAAEGAEAAA